MVSTLVAPTAHLLTSSCARPNRVSTAAWWSVALVGQFLLVFSVVALSSPGRIDIIDGQTRYEVAQSLVDHGDSVVRDQGCWFPIYKGRDGQRYTTYRLPQSLLGVGAIAASDATGPVSETRRQFFFTLISPLTAAWIAVIYAVWFRGLGHRPAASLAWGIGGVLCTPSWFYGTSTFDDILGTNAIVLAVTVAWLARDRRPILGAVVAGLAMGWAVNCKPPLAIFTLPVLAAAYRPQLPLLRQWAPAAIVCLGGLLGVGIYEAYEAYKFPAGAVEPEYLTGKPPQWTPNPLPGLAGLALSPGCGMLWYCPPVFLSWCGWRIWRGHRRQRPFCFAVLGASVVFTVFLSFLTFFKGEPCWGPRYMTPVFALWWVFVPAGCASVRIGVARTVLVLGVAVQMLALSVDPQRLFVQIPLHWGYYNAFPWLGFDGSISHLIQRPRELVEVLTPRDAPVPEYSPAPLPTHAGGINTCPAWATSLIGLMAGPGSALNGSAAMRPISIVQAPVLTQAALTRYHIFNSPRPWPISQWYLSEQARPVDLGKTIALLAAGGGLGLGLMFVSTRRRRQIASPRFVT